MAELLFDQKIKEIQQRFLKDAESRNKQKIDEIQQIENKRKLYELFKQHFSKDQVTSLLVFGGGFCVLCHRNCRINDYSQKIIIDDSIYCDTHGQLLMNHKPIHDEFVEKCEDCAVLHCPFRNPDHAEPEECPDCKEAFF